MFLILFFQSTGLKSYPVYHSVYETFELVEEYLDPGFQYHLAAARIWGEVARDIADSVIIPFDLRFVSNAGFLGQI